MSAPPFLAEVAFSRNLGLISRTEQERLARACVAIPGTGGVGGWHALTLARQGVGAFHLADFDTFSLANMNRQAGALISTLGQPKVEVIRKMILDINPTAEVTVWNEPISESNVDAFLANTDIVLERRARGRTTCRGAHSRAPRGGDTPGQRGDSSLAPSATHHRSGALGRVHERLTAVYAFYTKDSATRRSRTTLPSG